MKKIFMFLILGIFLLSFASASVDYIEDEETYVIDAFFPTWLGSNGLSTVEKISNTDYCLVDCSSTLKFNNEKPVILTEEIAFIDSYGRDVRGQIRDLEFLLGKYEDVEYNKPIYEEVCEEQETNSTNQSETVCYSKNVGEESYYINELVWRTYEGTEESGESYLMINAKKKPLLDTDWLITFRGEVLEKWDWWNSNWPFKKEISSLDGTISALYNITYSANMNSDFSDLRFLDSATELTELNYTIVSKVDGVSARIRVNNENATSIYMYYGNPGASSNSNAENVYFNPVLGYFYDNANANDFTSNGYDGTINGATLTTGTIDKGYNFNGLNQYIRTSNFDTTLNAYSVSFSMRWDDYGSGTTQMITEIADGTGKFLIHTGTGNYLKFAPNAVSSSCIFSGAIPDANFNNYTITYDDNDNTKLYVNGVQFGATCTEDFPTSTFIDDFNIGIRGTSTLDFDGAIDEFQLHLKELSLEEVQYIAGQTKPSFVTGPEQENEGVSTELIEPATGTNFTDPYINFTFSSIPNTVNLTNATLYLWNQTDNSLVLTNFTTLSGNQTINTSLQNNLTQGNYIWNAETCAESVGCSFASSNNSFVIHTGTPEIIISNPAGVIDYILIGENETLNYSIQETGVNISTHLEECWYEYNNTQELNNITYDDSSNLVWTFNSGYTNITEIRINQFSQSTTLTNIPELCSRKGNFTLKTIGFLSPFRTDVYCIDRQENEILIDSIPSGEQVLTTNITAMDKRPLDCEGNNTSFEYILGKNALCVHAIDEFGLHEQNQTTWEYKLTEIDQTYNAETTEGSLETFLANIRLGSSYSITDAVLFSYNNTMSTGQSFLNGSNTVLRNADFLIPNVNADENISFYWSVTLSDSTALNLTTQNQTIYNLAVDNCTTGTVELFNFTVVDEELQTILPGATIETAINIYDETRSQAVVNYSNIFNGVNPLTICLNRNVSSDSMYSVDTIVRYEDTTSANEYYNIVNSTLTNGTASQVITLYDLNLSDSTEFQLSFTGSDFLPVENALVYVDRQYISENTFKTVELPKTDYNGQSVLHLVRNDVIYNVRIIKDGVVLGNFENLVAFCDDFTIGDCNIELNAFDSVQTVFNYDEAIGLIFTDPEYNATSSDVVFNFVTSDGTAKTVRLEVSRNDIFGNRSVCSSTLISSGGTLTCAINPNIDESTLKIEVYSDEVLVVVDNVKIDSTNWGVAGYLVMFVMALSFIFMFSGTKTGILISLGVTMAGSIGLGIVSSDLIGVGASGMWLIVIIIIGIYKLNRERAD